MANKINKYSWIHDLNRAAIEAQMLSEATTYSNMVELNEAKRNIRMGQIERPMVDISPEENATQGLGRFMKDINAMSRPRMKRFSSDIVNIGSGIPGNPNFIAPPSENELLANMDKEERLLRARLAKVKGSVDSKPRDFDGDGDADAFDVEIDAKDGIMGNFGNETVRRLPSFEFARKEGVPEPRQHPAPQFSSKEEAEAFVRQLNQQSRGENSLMADLDIELDKMKARAGRKGTMSEMEAIARILGGR